ncbi:MAG TPA: hypothetical protein PK059_02170, partial [Cyclobacteriaceae bacterium]|nr:hypothetical protein [Cyclobacteriaceae bacterium]
SDHETGPQKIKVCIDGMILASQDYPYIPEEAQQKIIREQMVKDQNYDALNSRQVHKWLSMFKDKYYLSERPSQSEMAEPATPEAADKYAKQLLENIAKIGKPEFKNGMKDLRRKAGFEASISASQPRPEFVVGDQCPECKGGGEVCPNGNKYPVLCDLCMGSGLINSFKVHAASQEEADRAYQSFKQQTA